MCVCVCVYVCNCSCPLSHITFYLTRLAKSRFHSAGVGAKKHVEIFLYKMATEKCLLF